MGQPKIPAKDMGHHKIPVYLEKALISNITSTNIAPLDQNTSGVEPKPVAEVIDHESTLAGESTDEQTCSKKGNRNLHELLVSFPLQVHQDI